MNNEAAHILYISRIALHNIRCFRDDLVIDLAQPNRDKPSWTIILGDNGTGKTTLLRCMAMCLCDETSASGLLTELTGDVIRHDCEEATIELQLTSSCEPLAKYTITTTLNKTNSESEKLKQETDSDKNIPRNEVFACGYGAAYGTIGSDVYEKYRLLDSSLSLFNYHTRLWNPENALFRISREGVDLEELLARIDRILMLPPKSTRLDSSGLQIKGPWGKFVPAGALGDGYAATLSWLCDLLGWWLLAKRESFDLNLRGIVFLDEMEQHLHPYWQRAIIGLLAADFPGIQFIATTHAPLTVIGSSALSDECCQLVLLQQDGDGVIARSGLRPPRGRRADQVLTSYLFGLPTSGDDATKEQIERLAALSCKTVRSAQEEREVRDLRLALDRKLGSGESELERHIAAAVREVLEEAPKTSEFPKDALTFELRRQLSQLLHE